MTSHQHVYTGIPPHCNICGVSPTPKRPDALLYLDDHRGEWIWPTELCATCDRAVEDCGGCEQAVTSESSTNVHDSSSIS